MRDHCTKCGAYFAVFINPDLRLVNAPSDYEKYLLSWDMLRNHKFSWHDDITSLKNTIQEFSNILTSASIPCFSVQRFFDRPHTYGDMFIDFFHTAYRGNEIIAQSMHDSFIKNTSKIRISNVHERAIAKNIDYFCKQIAISSSLTQWLQTITPFDNSETASVGAIIMNCNPFTLGHEYIIEQSLLQTDLLYIFIVQEDLSFFSYSDRLSMMKEGTKQFGERVRIIPSGQFIISALTFPEYFTKNNADFAPDLTEEAIIFGAFIAKELRISKRFFGEEPFCPTTKKYTTQLKDILPRFDVQCVEIPRTCGTTGIAISASHVRTLIEKREFEALKTFLPETSLIYILKQIGNAFKQNLHKQ